MFAFLTLVPDRRRWASPQSRRGRRGRRRRGPAGTPRLRSPGHDQGRGVLEEAGRATTARSPRAGRSWPALTSPGTTRRARSTTRGDAEESARRAIALGGGSGVQVILGRALLSQHRFPEALAVAERAARGDGLANALLCDVLIELGRLDRARAAFAAYPGTDPLDRIALEARMLEAQGDSEALIGRLRELCDLADRMPQLPAELAAWYHVHIST